MIKPSDDMKDIITPPNRPFDTTLRLPIREVNKIGSIGTADCGKSSQIKTGMTISFSPANVKSVEMHHQNVEVSNPSHNVGLNLKTVSIKNMKRGNDTSNSKSDQVGKIFIFCPYPPSLTNTLVL